MEDSSDDSRAAFETLAENLKEELGASLGERPIPDSADDEQFDGKRVLHVNRIKGLLFSQGVSGYEPLRRDRRRRLDELQTGDGRPLPKHLKTQIGRALDRLRK